MLTDLEARWRNEQTPQAGLRLAEMLQRQGDRGRAEEILDQVEERLAADPRDLASRVALGRLRLACNQAAAAARALEAVVERDPTHLKANKLLVEVYLELDQRERARDRLDLYRLLNEGDPEIEALEGLLVGVAATAAAAPPRRRTLSVAGGDPFAALVAAPVPTVPAGSLFAPAAPAATATLGELYREQGHTEEAERIFRDVLEHEPDNLRARDALAAMAGGPAPAADDDRQRRIAALRDYLARIQRARGVPRG